MDKNIANRIKMIVDEIKVASSKAGMVEEPVEYLQGLLDAVARRLEAESRFWSVEGN